jgi:PAS domain S-box-containing protein
MRRRAAKMVRRSTIDLFMVFDEVPALIAYWDKSQRCCYANRSYVDWFNYRPEDLLGKTMVELLGPNLYERNRPYIEGALRGERQQFDRDLFHHPSGEMRHTQAHYIPDKTGNSVKGFTVLVFDVTDKVRAEKRALEAAEAKARFLAMMSHEIRTPLNGITGMTSLLLDTPLDSTQNQYVEAIQTSSTLLLSVLNDVLDFSKIEAGKLDFENVPFSLQHILNELLTALSFTARGKGLPLSFENQVERDAVFQGDPSRLKQVINNLISNAIKFTSSGHVALQVELVNQTHDVATLRFVVEDTGIGLSPETCKKLFQPFVQGDDSTARRFGGSGLGLSISKYLVERMGGEIAVESEEGKGSRFWFTVRLLRAAGSLKELSSASYRFDPQLRFQGHALVVDDVALNQAVATKMLDKLGMTSVAVSSGREALELLHKERFDLVFLDCNMPELDGYETAKLIRSSLASGAAEIPIIAMTASAMKGDMDKCLQAGMSDYISKPITPQQLTDVLGRWIRMHHAEIGSPCTVAAQRKPIIDRQVIEQLQSLVPLSHRHDLIQELFHNFAVMIPPCLEKMRTAVNNRDRKALSFEAHRIKSVGAALGAARFAALCEALETMPDLTAPAEVMVCLEQMAFEFTTFSAALHRTLGLKQQRHSA